GYLDGRRFRYDAENYLILSVPLPFECETHASPESPMLGIFVDIDVVRLMDMVAAAADELPTSSFDVTAVRCGVEPAPLDEAMMEVTMRLLRCLNSPLDARVLGSSIVNELLYRAMLGPHGSALYALTQHHTPYARIARVLQLVHRRYAELTNIDELAQEASMSTSTFHRAFKQVTGDSPLQYIKKIRLNKAKSLLVHEGVTVSDAAYQVGYESASQFSREFKRYFQSPPSAARTIGYSAYTSPAF
ncbi:MAG: AraC family transcriptional regulator, partial [Myxococcota bacterium]